MEICVQAVNNCCCQQSFLQQLKLEFALNQANLHMIQPLTMVNLQYCEIFWVKDVEEQQFY